MVKTRRNAVKAAAVTGNDNVVATLRAAQEQEQLIAQEERNRSGTKRPAAQIEFDGQRVSIDALKASIFKLAAAGAGTSNPPTSVAEPAPKVARTTANKPELANASEVRDAVTEARMDVKVNDAPNESGAFAQQLQITEGTVSLINLARLCLLHKDYDSLSRVLDSLTGRETWYLTCLRHLGTDRQHGLQATYEAWRAKRHDFWRAEFDPTVYDKALGDAILATLREENHSSQHRPNKFYRPSSAYDSHSGKDDRRDDRRRKW